MIHEAATEAEVGFQFFAIGSVNRVPHFQRINPMEDVLHALKAALDGVIPAIEHIHGFWAEFFFPNQEQIENSHEDVYGNYSPEHGYSDTPNLKRRVAATGIMVDRMSSGEQLDGYFGPPPVVWLNGDLEIPDDSRIRIFIREKQYLEYKVDRSDIIQGLDKALFRKLILQPIASIE